MADQAEADAWLEFEESGRSWSEWMRIMDTEHLETKSFSVDGNIVEFEVREDG